VGNTIQCRVKRIIATELGVAHEDLTPTCRLADIGADTLNLWEIAFGIEREVDAEICDDMRERCKTVGDLVVLAEQLAGEDVAA
jgi:acyl carrier protein